VNQKYRASAVILPSNSADILNLIDTEYLVSLNDISYAHTDIKTTNDFIKKQCIHTGKEVTPPQVYMHKIKLKCQPRPKSTFVPECGKRSSPTY